MCAYLLHTLLIGSQRITVDWEEVAQALTKLKVVDRLGSEVYQNQAFQHLKRSVNECSSFEKLRLTHLFIGQHARKHELCNPDSGNGLDLLRILIESMQQKLNDNIGLVIKCYPISNFI